MRKLSEFAGKAARFGFQIIADTFRPPVEFGQTWSQIAEIRLRSLPLIAASGLALGVVMTLHTRDTLVTFGAGAMIPAVQSIAFFVEIGPLVAALLVAGRVGTGIGAVIGTAGKRRPRCQVFSR